MGSSSLKVENARFILTVDDERRIIADGAILVEDGVITGVGKSADLRATGADRVIDAADMVVTPGFTNGHMHISYAHAVRGIFPDDVKDRLAYVFKMQFVMTAEEERDTSLLAAVELLKGGTTNIVDPGSTKYIEACLDAYNEAGIRVVTGEHVTDRENSTNLPVYDTAEAIRRMEDTVERFDGKLDGRVRSWTMPFSAANCSDEVLVAAKEIAERHHTMMTLHHFGGRRRPDGRLPTQHLADIGVLGPGLLLAHGMGLEPEEVELIAESGATVAMLPPTVLKGAMGLKEGGTLPELLERNVPVALGTDSVNSSNYSDMVRVMGLTATAYKDARRDDTVIPAETAVELATLNGARALGRGSDLGSIEVGKRADFVLFDTRRPEWQALNEPVNNLVYSADASSVHTVVVDGLVVVDDHKVPRLDEWRLIQRVAEIGERIRERTGVSFPSRWPVV
jgi:cytosine/adenosine deaminase-related metal-dependent hydrolase